MEQLCSHLTVLLIFFSNDIRLDLLLGCGESCHTSLHSNKINSSEAHLIWFSLCLGSLMINISDPADIGPVSITTDPKKFQQDLQELFVQVGTRTQLLTFQRVSIILQSCYVCTWSLLKSTVLIRGLLDWAIMLFPYKFDFPLLRDIWSFSFISAKYYFFILKAQCVRFQRDLLAQNGGRNTSVCF